ncbi:hypothetical protein QEN19_002444 [Hanseniaspora menglaensis]
MSCSCCDPFGDSDFDSDLEHEDISPINTKVHKIIKFINYLKANEIEINSFDKQFNETYKVFFEKENYDLSFKNIQDIDQLVVANNKLETELNIKSYIQSNLKE